MKKSDIKSLRDLVCNSHDADAENIKISFVDSKIIIEDDGHGIDSEMLQNWLVKGKTTKQRKGTSPQGRLLRGGGGEGRKNINLLGNKIKITSQTKTDKLYILQYDNTESSTLATKPKTHKHGTIIEITDIKEVWDKAKIKKLSVEIIRLYRLIALPPKTSCKVVIYKDGSQIFYFAYESKNKFFRWIDILIKLAKI